MIKANTKKHIHALALLLCALLSGCSVAGETTPQLEHSNAMPPPISQVGEGERSFAAQLYFKSEDGLRLVPETRDISYRGNISRAQAAVEALIKGPGGGVLGASMPQNMSLDRVELSEEACNVYLLASYAPETRDWLIARAAVAATVCDAEGVSSVNLYLNGVEPGVSNQAPGSITPITERLDAYIAHMLQEYEFWFLEVGSEAGSFATNTATLYFTDTEGKFLIARNTTLHYAKTEDASGLAEILISKLQEVDTKLKPVLPVDLALAVPPESIPMEEVVGGVAASSGEGDAPHPQDPEEQSSGNSVIILHFEQPSGSYDPQVLAGALTMTITGYIPKVEGVAIYIKAEDGSYNNLAGENKIFKRADFENIVGASIYLPFPDAEGSALCRVNRAIWGKSVYDPKVRIEELFKGVADPGLRYPIFSAEDIESVYIYEDTAVVNWNNGFGEKLKALLETADFTIPKERRERLFVYSVVNTLTEMPGIQRVWMLEGGKKLGAIGELYLGNALLRNPGIMINEG